MATLPTRRGRVIPSRYRTERHEVIAMAGRSAWPQRQKHRSGAPKGETGRKAGAASSQEAATEETDAPIGAPLPLMLEGAIDGEDGKLPRNIAREAAKAWLFDNRI